MKAMRFLLVAVFVLAVGAAVHAQTGFTGNAELELQFSPENPSMTDERIEVRLFADLAAVRSDGAAAILTSYSVPVGFDPSFVRLVSVEPGQAPGYSTAGFTYTPTAVANGRGFVTLMGSRSSDQNPGARVELGRLVFEPRRPGSASFTAGSTRTIHGGALAAVAQSSQIQPSRVSWTDGAYVLKIAEGVSIPSLLCHSWFSLPGMFQGIALLNQGTESASVQMLGWGRNGTLVQASGAANPSNPASLRGQNQMAKLTSQILLIPESTTVEHGWIEIKASQPDLSGFFMQGVNTAAGETHQMDGLAMTYNPASRLIFPLVQSSSRRPEIAVSNPAESAVDAEFRIIGTTGQILRTVPARVPAHGSFAQEIGEATDSAVYVDVVAANGGRLIGVERFGTAESIALLNGQDAELASNRLAGPQFASGFLGGSMRMDTSIALVNPSAEATTVVIRLINESGAEMAAPVVRTLAAGALFTMEGWKLFGLPDPQSTGKLTVGTISIESDRGIIGAQSFGDPVNGKYLAALPLLSTAAARREIFFGHVAAGLLGNVDYFTGIAMVNPSTTETAHINIELHGVDGAILAKTSQPYVLAPGSRNAQLVQQLIPGFPASQFGGYIRMTADIDVHAYMLIGDNYYNFLSAVP